VTVLQEKYRPLWIGTLAPAVLPFVLPLLGLTVNTASVGPSSTIRPRYMTATRSATCRTTERSCAMNR